MRQRFRRLRCLHVWIAVWIFSHISLCVVLACAFARDVKKYLGAIFTVFARQNFWRVQTLLSPIQIIIVLRLRQLEQTAELFQCHGNTVTHGCTVEYHEKDKVQWSLHDYVIKIVSLSAEADNFSECLALNWFGNKFNKHFMQNVDSQNCVKREFLGRVSRNF